MRRGWRLIAVAATLRLLRILLALVNIVRAGFNRVQQKNEDQDRCQHDNGIDHGTFIPAALESHASSVTSSTAGVCMARRWRLSQHASINTFHSFRLWSWSPDWCSDQSLRVSRRDRYRSMPGCSACAWKTGFRLVRNHSASGTEKPILRRVITSSGTYGASARLKMCLPLRPFSLKEEGSRQASSPSL